MAGYTRYTYSIQIDVDDDSGNAVASITSESGECGTPTTGSIEKACEGAGRAIANEVIQDLFGVQS